MTYSNIQPCVASSGAHHAAAPAGGAATAGRGCVLAVCLIACAPVSAYDLPSGTQAALHEVLLDQVGAENYVRFRFVAPVIDRSTELAPDYTALEGDFPHLCARVALPYIAEHGLSADKIIISLADRITDFGVATPEATQYFEQFRPENGDCIWEGF